MLLKDAMDIKNVKILILMRVVSDPGLHYLPRPITWTLENCVIFEPHREKTGFLPMRKQRRRSASR